MGKVNKEDITVYLIKESMLVFSKKSNIAYTDKKVAERICKDREEEFVSHSVEEKRGEIISNNRIIVEDKVYDLNETNESDDLFMRTLSKLTKEEIDNLCLNFGKEYEEVIPEYIKNKFRKSKQNG